MFALFSLVGMPLGANNCNSFRGIAFVYGQATGVHQGCAQQQIGHFALICSLVGIPLNAWAPGKSPGFNAIALCYIINVFLAGMPLSESAWQHTLMEVLVDVLPPAISGCCLTWLEGGLPWWSGSWRQGALTRSGDMLFAIFT